MSEYRFSVVVVTDPLSDEQILDATDALAAAGCTDASIRGHVDGIELLFERKGASLQAAMASAVSDVEKAGFRVAKAELEREAIVT